MLLRGCSCCYSIIIILLINSSLIPAELHEGEEELSPSPFSTNVGDEGSSSGNAPVCKISSPCDAISYLEKGNILHLGRRILSLEQPLWKHSSDNLRWSACAEGPCRCSPEAVTVNCWRLSMDVIPQQQTIPIDTVYMDLGSNKIQSIHRHTFKSLTRLVQLDLSDNLLDYLPHVLFENLESLKYLLLHRNFLDFLHPRLFIDLKNLETLDLSENKLLSIPPTIWIGVNSLKILQLSRNHLQEWIQLNGTLRTLEEFDLTGNSVKMIKGYFGNLLKLRTLKLGENQLNDIPKNLFKGMKKLNMLSLHQNKIKGLDPFVFQGLDHVINLDLSDNHITKLNGDNFRGLSSLVELNIARNHLSTLENDTFVDLHSLDRLSLHGNNLEMIEPNAFKGLKNLTWLLLGNNMLQQIAPESFHPVSNLTRLELDSNELLFIADETLEHLRSLQSIKLGKNAWHCDCNILYLANWVRDHSPIVWDYQPKCRGPTSLGGRPLHEMTFADVCDGQWLSMQRIPSRL